MANVKDLGTLMSASLGDGPVPPFSFSAIAEKAAAAAGSNQEIAARATERQEQFPSIWFVNFPDHDASTKGSRQLATYMQNILDYRSWASLIWNRTTFSNTSIPQDGSQASVAIQNAYTARVGVHHMKLTPWLAVNSDTNQTKTITSDVKDFHMDLLKAVLSGFVNVTEGVLHALEGILTSLTQTVSHSQGSNDTKMMVCERYEYIAQADVIRSYVRLISFSVTQSMKEVNRAKQHSRTVTCTIAYNDYEAVFNQRIWTQTKKDIEQDQLDAAKDFVNGSTIDVLP